MTRRIKHRKPDSITNLYVKDRGRVYRLCFRYSQPILVALKGKRHERMLDVNGRRARQLLRGVSVQWTAQLDPRTAMLAKETHHESAS